MTFLQWCKRNRTNYDGIRPFCDLWISLKGNRPITTALPVSAWKRIYDVLLARESPATMVRQASEAFGLYMRDPFSRVR